MIVSLATSTPARSGPPAFAPHMICLPLPCCRASRGSVAELDRHADQAAVLGPRTVVVLDVLLAEQLVQHEPGERGALADPAVRDGVGRQVDALGLVEGLELVVALEGAVVVGVLRP